MPSARPSAFKGGGGILRNVDGVITDIQFTTENPFLAMGYKPKPGKKKSDFNPLFGVLTVMADGADKAVTQPLFVGDGDVFGITDDGHGITGEGELSKSSAWYVFLASLVGAGFDESNFDDSDPTVADYSPIIGARCRFGWQLDERSTKKLGQKVNKGKDGKERKYDRENLIVTAYHGQQDLEDDAPAPAAKTSKTTGQAKSGPAGKKSKTVDIAQVASDAITVIVSESKNQTINKSKLGPKLLTQLSDTDPAIRQQVREWAKDDDNLASIDGVDFDSDSGDLSIS